MAFLRELTHDPAAPRVSAGVYTLDCLRSRCHVDADTGCWLWRGAMSQGTRGPAKVPVVKVPPGVLGAGEVQTTAQRAAYAMAHGRLPAGWRVWRRCGQDDCAAPSHLLAGTTQAWGA